MKKKIAAAVVAVAVVLAVVAGAGRSKTWTTVSDADRARLAELPAHPEVPAAPDLVVERSIVIAAPPTVIYDLLADVEGWPKWDPAIAVTRSDAHRPLLAGDSFFKEEAGTAITARALEAQPGQLLRWRGLAPGGIVGVHSFRFVVLADGRTLVVDREEYSAGFLRLFGFATDLGIGAQFEGTLAALKAAAESAR